MTVRTRFAPSPTGLLHIGGVRTALFCWLYARKHGGTFILRVEDTDRERSTPEAVQVILDGMDWLGLHADEGPFYQTQRYPRYREVIQQWLAQGKAYHCYCSKEELEAMRNAQLARKEKPRYDGRCRERTAPVPGITPVVRFRNPLDGAVVVDDAVHGKVAFQNAELDDLIIERSDGNPTYNFCVVVDDYDMQVTHVIRGDDHLNNTPRQMNMLRAMGVEPPVYAHLPMILGPDGTKLSKRHGAVSVLYYREEGYLPEALLNYLARLGWSHGDQEIFTLEEMTALFDIKDVNKSASAINPDKLAWINQQHLMKLPPSRIAQELRWQLERLGVDVSKGPALEPIIEAQRERSKTLKEMAAASRFFFAAPEAYDEKAARKNLNAETKPLLEQARRTLSELAEWTAPAIHAAIQALAETTGAGLGKIAQPLRVAVSGGGVSPPIDQTLAILGREATLARVDRAIDWAARGAA
ncbi:MAG TPA: glutamate--tRNA ligase [Steroidobacteraceae bacterium]|nr:glutamate--tRNA ligase [Steroidobacteraceae bacterium]